MPHIMLYRAINQAWKYGGIDQRCKDDMVKVGSSWTNYMWPASENSAPDEGKSDGRLQGIMNLSCQGRLLYNNGVAKVAPGCAWSTKIKYVMI